MVMPPIIDADIHPSADPAGVAARLPELKFVLVEGSVCGLPEVARAGEIPPGTRRSAAAAWEARPSHRPPGE